MPGYCVNYGDLVRTAFEAADRVPEWAQGWMRKRLAEHLTRDPAARAPLRPGEASGAPDASWCFLATLPPGQRLVAEGIRAASSSLAARARENGEAPVRFEPPVTLAASIARVRDWLHALPETQESTSARAEGLVARSKLSKLTLEQALAASERWHAALARRAGRDAASVGDRDAVETVLDLGDGSRWVRLLTPEARDHEGASMGHCVGSGGYDETVILSLRDAKNRPHVTVEMGEDGTFEQIKGRGNGAIARRHVPAVLALVERLQPPWVDEEDALLFGHIWLENRLHTLDAIPSGTRIPYHFRVRGDESLRRLPDGLQVGGGMGIFDCPALETLPQGLNVGEDLFLLRCGALRALPQGLCVRGALYASGCTGLRELPDDFQVGGRLTLEGCTVLERLPEGLRVMGPLYLTSCTGLLELPAGLEVRGNLIAAGCTALARIGTGTRVAGDLALTGCTALAGLPEGLGVQNNMYLEGCSALRSLPSGLKLRCLSLRGCTALECLPSDLHVAQEIDLTDCASLRVFPACSGFSGWLSLRGCTALEGLPDDLTAECIVLPDGSHCSDPDRARAWFRSRPNPAPGAH